MLKSFGSHIARSRHLRFVHVGVAAALAAATVAAIGVLPSVGADGVASSYVPIVPCRLADTRSGADHIGARASALGAAEVVTFAVRGTNGNCTIPNTATGIATNVTAVNPSAASYVTIYPSDASPRPTASNLNFVAGSPPTPNQVTVSLSATGSISAFNNGGSVDLVIDIVGYYLPAGVGTPGPQGPQGIQGVQGIQGIQGIQGPRGVATGGSVTFTGQNATFNTDQAVVEVANGCALLTDTGQLFVPLTVPDGATIVAVRVRTSDKAETVPGYGGSADYQLFRVNSGIDEHLVASFGSVDGLIDTPMVFGPQSPVSLGNLYYLKATIASFFTPQKLCAVTVDYTM